VAFPAFAEGFSQRPLAATRMVPSPRTGYDRGDQTINRADAHIIVCAIQAQNRISFVIAEEFVRHAAALLVSASRAAFQFHARSSCS